MTVIMHPDINRLTSESPFCNFCVAEGGLEEGLLIGFHIGVALASKGSVAACESHRIRLSFYFELSERVRDHLDKPIDGRESGEREMHTWGGNPSLERGVVCVVCGARAVDVEQAKTWECPGRATTSAPTAGPGKTEP